MAQELEEVVEIRKKILSDKRKFTGRAFSSKTGKCEQRIYHKRKKRLMYESVFYSRYEEYK